MLRRLGSGHQAMISRKQSLAKLHQGRRLTSRWTRPGNAIRSTIVVALWLSSLNCAAETWRFPSENNMTGDWKVVQEQMPTPFRVSADFDGNGIDDEIWIVIETSGAGWRLIALMNGGHVPMTLVSSAYGTAQTFGIEKVEPGVFKTACGKGYGECDPGETDQGEGRA